MTNQLRYISGLVSLFFVLHTHSLKNVFRYFMSLEQLFRLYEQDGRIHDLNREIVQIRTGMRDQIAEIRSIETRIDQFYEKEKQFEVKLRATEVEVQAAEEELKRLQNQKMQVSSEKMLSGVEKKIETQSTLVSALEDKWFEEQEALEVSRENLKQMKIF